MRKYVAALLAAFLCLACSVPAFAYLLPYTWMEDGNTMLGTFKIAELSEELQQDWTAWQNSPRNLCYINTSGMACFMVVPDHVSLVSIVMDGVFVRLNFSGGLNEAHVECYKAASVANTAEWHFEEGFYDTSSHIRISAIIGGTYFGTTGFKFPDIGDDYLPEYEGNLVIVDDLGGTDTGFLGWLSKLWDWLCSFWETLKNLFISLFVPPSGYFDNWFNEIRTAFEKKLGGMLDVIDQIQNSFGGAGVTGEGLKFTLADDLFYDGFSGVTVDLLGQIQPLLSKARLWVTGFIMLWTVIRCYKRVIALTNT